MTAREVTASTPYDLLSPQHVLSAEGTRLDSRGFEEFRNVCAFSLAVTALHAP